MSRFAFVYPLAGAAVGVTLLAAGCPQQGSILGGGLTGTTLSGFDQDAIAAGLQSIESATSSINTTQYVTEQEQSTARDTNCPTVDLAASTTGGFNLSVGVDFGTEECTPPFGGEYCKGSASGTISALTSTLALNFEALQCDGKSLDGTVEFGYEQTADNVSVTGDWDITYAEGDSTVALNATGEATFTFVDLSTTFVSLNGVIDDNGKEYSCEWSNIVTSVFDNDNYIPQAGEMNISGNGIKTMTVRFNAGSPSTGDVEVSINGGAFFVYNLFEQE